MNNRFHLNFRNHRLKLDGFKSAISTAFNLITPEMLHNTRINWIERMCMMIGENLHHIEPFLK